jgi:hypothetical protein
MESNLNLGVPEESRSALMAEGKESRRDFSQTFDNEKLKLGLAEASLNLGVPEESRSALRAEGKESRRDFGQTEIRRVTQESRNGEEEVYKLPSNPTLLIKVSEGKKSSSGFEWEST